MECHEFWGSLTDRLKPPATIWYKQLWMTNDSILLFVLFQSQRVAWGIIKMNSHELSIHKPHSQINNKIAPKISALTLNWWNNELLQLSRSITLKIVAVVRLTFNKALIVVEKRLPLLIRLLDFTVHSAVLPATYLC